MFDSQAASDGIPAKADESDREAPPNFLLFFNYFYSYKHGNEYKQNCAPSQVEYKIWRPARGIMATAWVKFHARQAARGSKEKAWTEGVVAGE